MTGVSQVLLQRSLLNIQVATALQRMMPDILKRAMGLDQCEYHLERAQGMLMYQSFCRGQRILLKFKQNNLDSNAERVWREPVITYTSPSSKNRYTIEVSLPDNLPAYNNPFPDDGISFEPPTPTLSDNDGLVYNVSLGLITIHALLMCMQHDSLFYG